MKKFFKAVIFTLLPITSALTAHAQVDEEAYGYYQDASRFSQIGFGGTARILGLGGASTALGADISNIYNNPAGLGLYRKSDLSISTGFNFANSTSNFLGKQTKDNKQNFNIPNFGVVFAKAKDDLDSNSTYRGGGFGISFTRVNNFHNEFSYEGTNNDNSMMDYFAEISNGYSVDDLDAQYPPNNVESLPALAYWTYLIDPVYDANDNHVGWAPMISGVPVKQKETVTTKGNQNEWNFSYGGNIDDRVYFGAGLGIATIKYLQEKVYKETPNENEIVENYTLTDNLKIRGTGVNFKIGAIFKAADFLRLGLNLQSPTYYSIKTEYQYQIKSRFHPFTTPDGFELENENEKTTPGFYNYNLTTPARIKGGVAIIAGKAGFITADAELVSYNTARLKSDELGELDGDNTTIKNVMKPAVNYNVGAELRNGYFRYRAGFAYIADPYKKGVVDNVNRSVLNFSLGGGYRNEDMYLDLAFVKSYTNSKYSPYALSNGREPVAGVKNRNLNFTISVGSFF